MRTLLNTLFITTPSAYLSLEGESILVNKEETVLGKVPLRNLEQVITLGYAGASPELMYACTERNISLTFLSSTGKFRAKVVGESCWEAVLRKNQYRLSQDELLSNLIARNFVKGQVANQRWVVEQTMRESQLNEKLNSLEKISSELSDILVKLSEVENLENLSSLKSQATSQYTLVLDEMISQQKEDFYFEPLTIEGPKNNLNALLSFAYTLLMSDMISALETVGIDPYVGFCHRDYPENATLALEMVEEIKSIYADRFVLNLINNQLVTSDGFLRQEDGTIVMDERTRKLFIHAWQTRKKQKIRHPYLGEKISWGLVPYTQALLLARFLRGDLVEYPSFQWK